LREELALHGKTGVASRKTKDRGIHEGQGRIRFAYRALYDVVIATVDWALNTEEDVLTWYEEYQRYFTSTFDRKVDVIFELANFTVSPKIAALFGEYRAKMLREFTGLTYRVHLSTTARTLMYTSSALTGAPANEFPSIEAAIAALENDRSAGRGDG
jgi:hypothetical protein